MMSNSSAEKPTLGIEEPLQAEQQDVQAAAEQEAGNINHAPDRRFTEIGQGTDQLDESLRDPAEITEEVKKKLVESIDNFVKVRLELSKDIATYFKKHAVEKTISIILKLPTKRIYQLDLLSELDPSIKKLIDDEKYVEALAAVEATETFEKKSWMKRLVTGDMFQRGEKDVDCVNRFARAFIQRLLKNKEEALVELDALLDRGFLHKDVYCLKATIHHYMGKKIESEIDCIFSCYASWGNPLMIFNYGIFLLKHKEVFPAKLLFKETVMRQPYHIPAYIYLSIIQRYEIIARVKRYSENIQDKYKYNILAQVRVLNYANRGNWVIYSTNRMAIAQLLKEHARGVLGFFGAGNCNNIDVNFFTKYYEKIELVDYDKYALAYARRIQALKKHPKISYEFDVDVTGIMKEMFFWNIDYPKSDEIDEVIEKAREFKLTIEQRYDVLLIDCLLSEFIYYLDAKLTKEHPLFNELFDAVLQSFYRNIFNAIKPGGTIILISEQFSSERTRDFINPASLRAQRLIEQAQERQGEMIAGLNLYLHEKGLRNSKMYGPRIDSTEVVKPWVWFYPGINYLNSALIIKTKS